MKSIRSITLAVLIAVATIGITGCKKYEEGPAFSLRSKKARVVGKWKVEKAWDNGTDITSTYDALNYRLEFKENGDLVLSRTVAGITVTSTQKWEFSSDKEKIIIIDGSTRYENQITRLKNKEFWIKAVNPTTDIDEIHLASVE